MTLEMADLDSLDQYAISDYILRPPLNPVGECVVTKHLEDQVCSMYAMI
jgi:hypothetical protein